MLRGPAILLLSALAVFGQGTPARRPGASTTPSTPRTLAFDAVVTDAEGRPAAGLAAADFNLLQAGEAQTITSLTYSDSIRHTASASAPSPLEINPDSNHRNLILVVDDLGLSPARAGALEQVLGKFFESQISSDDRVAVIRTSSGRGTEQQFTGDRSRLAASLGRIQPLAQNMSERAFAAAIWQSIRWAAEGLRDLPGRKAIVLLSEHLQLPVAAGVDFEYSRLGTASAAHAAMAVFYAVDPRGAAQLPKDSTLAWLARETGGLIAPDLAAVLRDQEGYYVLAFQPAPEPDGVAGTPRSTIPPVVELRRKDLTVRWRYGYVSTRQHHSMLGPADPATLMQEAQASALAGPEIHTLVTAMFAGFSRDGAVIDVMVHLDVRDLSVLRPIGGDTEVSADIQVAAYGEGGKVTGPPARNYTWKYPPADYQRACAVGVVYSTRLTLPGPGGYQVRAVTADGLSDRFGAAMHYVEIPPINQGSLGLSGLMIRADPAFIPASGRVDFDSPGSPSVRQFQRGTPVAFAYGVFNATRNSAKEGEIETRTRIYASSRIVYEGAPVTLKIRPETSIIPQVAGKVTLDPNISPGEYVLYVQVDDKMAAAGAPRTASQFMTFQVRE